jgi:DNA-binding MarR family transcriptional regulator
MKAGSLIEIDQQKDRADRRTKTVTVTDAGWESLKRLTERLSFLTGERSGRASKRQAA